MTGGYHVPIARREKDFSQRAHRRLIGVLGLLLPLLLYVVAGLRPTPPLPRWAVLPSISAYQYTGASGILVGVLFALGLLLFTYQGYEGVIADRVVGFVGGVGAMGSALFPPDPFDGVSSPPWWTCTLGIIHYVSTVVLFVAFILFSLWLFRKSSIPERAQRPLDKRRRDAVYLACGLVMIAAVLWAGSSVVTHAPEFVPEVIAIEAFAVSWLVKGEAHQGVLAAMRKMRSKAAGAGGA